MQAAACLFLQSQYTYTALWRQATSFARENSNERWTNEQILVLAAGYSLVRIHAVQAGSQSLTRMMIMIPMISVAIQRLTRKLQLNISIQSDHSTKSIRSTCRWAFNERILRTEGIRCCFHQRLTTAVIFPHISRTVYRYSSRWPENRPRKRLTTFWLPVTSLANKSK